ncbi:MAG: Holliday junction resolvase [Maritalea sp.]|jgi:Holliday junction resolvase
MHGCGAVPALPKFFLLHYIVVKNSKKQPRFKWNLLEMKMTHTNGFFRSVLDAMVSSRSKHAERQVARFLKTQGHDAINNDRMNGF